ncbi:MAG: hypothetical protein K1X38_01930 [Microthrixaceae bacterium]|nr:hypothetical protein [Microthrixaceae bacterium]
MTTYVVTGRRGADLPLHDLGHPSSTLATAEMLRDVYQARGWLDVSIVDSSSDTPALEASTLECLDTADGALLSARDAASDIGLDASLHLTVGVPTNLLLEAHKWVWWFGGMGGPASVWSSGSAASVWSSGSGLYVATPGPAGCTILSTGRGRSPVVSNVDGSTRTVMDHLFDVADDVMGGVSRVDLTCEISTGMLAIRSAWEAASASALASIVAYRTS